MSRQSDTRASLAALARALGGDCYDGGRRALVPAPGHSAADRSVSLRLAGDRLLVHSFGGADWREILADLRARRWIDGRNRLLGCGGAAPSPPPDRTRRERIEAALRLWDAARPVASRDPAFAYAARRGVLLPPGPAGALRALAEAPFSAYRGRGPGAPALIAAIREPGGDLCAVEITYLDAAGRRSDRARPARKIIGVVPAGSAVRLAPAAPAAPDMLVAEGVFTTLSAMARFGLPGWALLSTTNLRRWSPPGGVRRVTIAADRGADGERSAGALSLSLRRRGVAAEAVLPPEGYGDWNDLDQDEARRKGGDGRPDRGDGP